MHPKLRRLIEEVYEQESGCSRRANQLLLATESAWVILGLADQAKNDQVGSLASIAAGFLAAEGKQEARPEAVRLRLIKGGEASEAPGDEHQEDDPGTGNLSNH